MKSPEAADSQWKSMLRITWVFGLWTMVAGTPLDAQLQGEQYTAPGTTTSFRATPSKDEFQSKLQDSPWKAGPLHLRPWIGLKDISFVENLNDQGQSEDEDFTLTVGAGLRGYVPIGQKVVFAAHALPEYVWWQDNDVKRRLNGRYGLGVFAFLNRLTAELSHRQTDQQEFFSSEFQTLTSTQIDASTLNLELELTNNISVFGLALRQKISNLEDESVRLSALDRTEEIGTLGFRYSNSSGWAAEIAHVDRSDDFSRTARNISNSGTSQRAMIGLIRSGKGFRLTVETNDREADRGSVFGTFTGTTGAFDALWEPYDRLTVLGYARRQLTYSIDENYSHILGERFGGRVDFDFNKAIFTLFTESGEDDYQNTSLSVLDRLDDINAYGASLQIELKEISFRVSASRTEYDSNIDGFDRDVSRVNFNFKLDFIRRLTTQLADRLSLGRVDTVW